MNRHLPGDIISRRKGPVMHHGVVLQNGHVLHNTPFRGVHVSSPEDFSKNKAVKTSRMSRHQRESTLARLTEEPPYQRRYNPFTNNCEHTVTRATHGHANSPQLKGLVVGLVVGAVGLALTRSPAVAVGGFLLGKKLATRRILV